MKQKINPLIIGVIIVAFFLILGKSGFNLFTVSGFTDVKRGIVIGGTTYTSGIPTVYSNYPLTVQLAITTSASDKAFTVHEEAPFNVQGLSTNIYEFALIDQVQVQDEIKTYQITPTSIGSKTFTGKYAVNGGADQIISGVNTINVILCTAITETCNNLDDDCDYLKDEDLTQSCYTGPSGTQNIGICKGGTQSCSVGVWSGCSGQVLPTTEICNNAIDEDCNGVDLTSKTKADTNCNQKIDWDEINAAINKWLQTTYTWTEINQMISVWISG